MNESKNDPLETVIIDEPIRFRLFGLSSVVENRCYGDVGLRLMNEMWRIVKQAKLATTGINHWVYFADDRMFVGVEVRDAEQATIPKQLEPCEFELNRYSKHVHVGPYHELPQKWRALKNELAARGESVTMPSLEVYGHSCEGDDDSKAETTILMGLHDVQVRSHPRFTTVWDVDGVVVVRFHDLNATVLRMDNMGDIDRVFGELSSVADRNPFAVILDFENTDFVPVAAFENLLLRLHNRLNGKLSMCNLSVTVVEQFETNQLATLFPIHADLEDALGAVKVPHLELQNGHRIPLVADRLLVGRIPFDEEKHRNVLGITKEQARCEGDWLYLPDPHVSKRHAILTRTDDDKYTIEDTDSTSGTFVNDHRVTERTTLEFGDTIKVGELEIVYGDQITQNRVFLWQQRFDGD